MGAAETGAVPAAPPAHAARAAWAAPHSAPTRADRVVLAACAVWVTALMMTRWPVWRGETFGGEYTMIDAAAYAEAGELLLRGGAPYVAYWDHKPPLIHLVNALGLAVAGGRVWGLWVLTLAAFLGALVLGHVAMRRAFGAAGAILGTVYFAASLPFVAPTNLPEGYVLPLQWGAVLLVVGARPLEPARRALGAGVALGALGALAALLKPTFIGAAASVAVVLSWMLLAERRAGTWAGLVVGGAAGALLVAGPVLAFLAARGSLGAFADQVLHYNAVYVQASAAQRARTAYAGLRWVTEGGGLFLPAAGWLLAAYRLWRGGRGDPLHAAVLLAIVWLPMELLLCSLSGRFFPYNFALLYPPTALLAAYFAFELATAGEGVGAVPVDARRRAWALRAVCAMAIGLAVGSANETVRRSPRTSNGDVPAREAQIAQTVAYLRAHTAPGDPILVWGHAAYLYFFADRRPASRYIYSLPLLTPGYVDSAVARRFVDELRASPPTAIVDATGPLVEGGYVAPLGRWDPDWGYPERRDAAARAGRPAQLWWSMPPALRLFYAYLAANYVVADSVGPAKWAVYRRAPRVGATGTAP